MRSNIFSVNSSLLCRFPAGRSPFMRGSSFAKFMIESSFTPTSLMILTSIHLLAVKLPNVLVSDSGAVHSTKIVERELPVSEEVRI